MMTSSFGRSAARWPVGFLVSLFQYRYFLYIYTWLYCRIYYCFVASYSQIIAPEITYCRASLNLTVF